jgi:hypothetical protein
VDLKERFLRADWLRELQGLSLCGLVVVGAGLAVVVGLAITGPLDTSVPADQAIAADALTELRPGVTLNSRGMVDVSIRHPSPGQAALGILAVAPTALVVLAMFAILLGVIRHARRHNPFTAATVLRLRWLGVVVMIGGALAWAVEFAASFALVATVSQSGAGGTLTLIEPMMWLVIGFGYLTVAEVVNRGRAMRDELADVI